VTEGRLRWRPLSLNDNSYVANWHKADQPIALADVRFRRNSELALSTCDAARPSVAAAVSLLRAVLVADYFFFSVLNETPSRIATLRMRSGLRFMIRAASSRDFDALASSITRRSFAKDHDLGIGENAPFKRQSRQPSMFADGFAWGPDEGNRNACRELS
jgi:hypothetical protein